MSPTNALRSACSCRHGRAGADRWPSRRISIRANRRQTVCRRLRILPSQRRAARQGPLSPHALSVSAKTLCQQFEFGLGAGVLSGIHRQRKARRSRSLRRNDRRLAIALVAAGTGAGAISHDLLTAVLRNLLSPAIFSTFAGLASWAFVWRGVTTMVVAELKTKVEKYETKASRCEQQAREATD